MISSHCRGSAYATEMNEFPKTCAKRGHIITETQIQPPWAWLRARMGFWASFEALHRKKENWHCPADMSTWRAWSKHARKSFWKKQE